MVQPDLLYASYSSWLAARQNRTKKKILLSFKSIVDNFFKAEFIMENRVLYLNTHVTFLIQVVSNGGIEDRHQFPLIIAILNLILRVKYSFKITLNKAIISGIRSYFYKGNDAHDSGQLLSNVLWLICKCLHGTYNKKQAMRNLGKSGLIIDFLAHKRFDCATEKAICMLCHYISKSQQNKHYIVSALLENAYKFQQAEAFEHVLATLKDCGLETFQWKNHENNQFQNILVRYIGMEDVSLTAKMKHLDLIAFATLRNPSLLGTLRVNEIIESKLVSQVLTNEPLLLELLQIIELQLGNSSTIEKYLHLASLNLTNNVLSRRVFILFHEKMTASQVICIMMGGLPSALLSLLSCVQQLDKGIKLLICLKLCARRLGLNRIFWYSCKSLIQKLLTYKFCSMAQPTADLFQLFEDSMQEEIDLLNI